MSGSNSSAPGSGALPRRAEALALTVHGVDGPDLGDAEQAARRRTAAGRLRMLLVLAVCAAPVLASYVAYYLIRPQSQNAYGTLIQPTRSLPDLALATLDGRPMAARALVGQWLLVVVAPAACAADCEARLFMQRQLREMLGRERERVDKVWFVTDGGMPAPALRAAVDAQPPVTVLRVDRAALAAWLAPAPGRALEDHLYVVDPLGEWMMRMPHDADPARVKRDLERLLRAAAGWDRPGR
jgi:cytochrome oxidase Cu insertion factor (SCO1/SenC/PrrC family)